MTKKMEDKTPSLTTSKSSNDIADSVSVELKKAREAKGYSFADLHRLTGLSRTTLHQYEAGTRKPGARELVLLCSALETSPNRILFGTDDLKFASSGVLVPLLHLAKIHPNRALDAGVLLLPTIVAILLGMGDNTLRSLATLADEALRTRSPESFSDFSKLVTDLIAASDTASHGSESNSLVRVAYERAGFCFNGSNPDK